MYAIIIKRAIQKPDAISISEHIAKTDEKKANVQTIRYDDEFEPEDEEYDVYIGGNIILCVKQLKFMYCKLSCQLVMKRNYLVPLRMLKINNQLHICL